MLGALTLLVDGGANTGQFAMRCTALGRVGGSDRLVRAASRTAFGALSRTAGQDPQWEVFNLALGAAGDRA